MVCGGRIAQNFTRVGAPRHGECVMRGSESPLTLKMISYDELIFEVIVP